MEVSKDTRLQTDLAPRSLALRASRSRRFATDVLSGSTAACVVVIQAMAFGIAVYAPYGGSAAAGAGAGLIGAICLCLASNLLRGTTGLVSAPTGPVLVMLSAITAKLALGGLHGLDVIAALSLVVMLAGVFQCLIGLSGGGKIVKFVPLPVVAGFMTGSGVLMLGSQLVSATGLTAEPGQSAWDWDWAWIPSITTIATIGVTLTLRRLRTTIPPVLGGLLAGTAVFHLLTVADAGSIPALWLVGSLPDLASASIALTAVGWPDLPWLVIAVSALLLAVFTALDTLLTSLVADTETGARHDARRELVGQGLGHVLSGLFGGIAGAGTTAATVVAVRAGGRVLTGVACAAAVLLATTLGRDLTGLLPISALAGIIIYVAWGLLEPTILRWWKRGQTRTDALIAILVAVVTIALDLMLAVALGFAITALRFIVAQIRAPVVHRRVTAPQTRSGQLRPPRELELLAARAHDIVLYELRGTLVFATADRLFAELTEDIDAGKGIVLSLRRVEQVDLTGTSILRNMCARARAAGGEIVFANVRKRTGLTRKVAKSFKRAGFDLPGQALRTFKSSDVALEYLENRLLKALGMPQTRAAVALENSQLCADWPPPLVEVLRGYLVELTVPRGARIYQAEEPGSTLYLVLAGAVDIRLPTGRHHWSRIARIGPGMVFGEVSFHTPGPHTATTVATRNSQLLTLAREDFEQIRARQPEVAIRLLAVLGQVLGRRLRRANVEIDRLNRF